MTIKSKRYQKGIIVKPTTSAATEEGEIRNDSSDNKLKTFTEGSEREVVTADQTQTLSNKTLESSSNTINIDADISSVSNLEVDNLKVGVLETDLNNAVDDTKLPSAQAVKSFIAQEVATKDEASEIAFDDTNVNVTGTDLQSALDDVANSAAAAQTSGSSAQASIDAHIADSNDAHDASAISNVPSGNLAATDVQGALNELQTELDNKATSTELSNHLIDAVDAHDASTISNIPTGNLVATDVQSALDELQGDIDTLNTTSGAAQTSIDNHIADLSDTHDASAISNVPSGNLAATDVQGALDELQSDIDGRADASALTSHTTATSGVHGVTGDVVGTTDTQTLTNKTLSGSSIENPTRLDPKKDTKANLELYATTATNGELVFATDEKRAYQVVDAELVSIGGSGIGGADIFHVERFEDTEAVDFSTGNNATFLGAGSLAGTLTNQEVTPMSGDRSLQYTQGAGSLNDYIASPIISLDPKQAGNDSGVNLYFTYTGDSNDIKVVVYDNTNGALISSSLDLLSSASNPTRFSTSVHMPSGVTEIRWGVQVVTENVGAVLILDDVEFSLNPFVYKDLLETETYQISQDGADMSGTTGEIRFNIATATVLSSGSKISVTDDAANTRTIATMIVGGLINASVNYRTANVSDSVSLNHYASNGVLIDTYLGGKVANSADTNSSSFKLVVNAGDFFTIENTVGVRSDATQCILNISLVSESERVITPAKSNLTDPEVYIPVSQGFGTLNTNTVRWHREGSFAVIRGNFVAGTVDGSEAQIGLPSGLTIGDVGNVGVTEIVGTFIIDTTTNTNGGAVLATTGDSFLNFSTQSVFGAATVTATNPIAGNNVIGSGGEVSFTARVPIEGWSNDATFLAAIPTTKIAIIEDQKANNVDGGTATAGSYLTRDLNTVSGDSEIVSLSSNRFTLHSGKYLIETEAPAFLVNRNQSRLYNVTNSSVEKLGTSRYADVANLGETVSTIKHIIEISSQTEYELQHQVQSTYASQGFGVASNFGDTEIYARVVITKIK